jgi:Na+/melibiose symporter-like transporter
MGKDRREFSWIEGLAFCLAAIAIQLTSEATAQWGTYFYSPSDTGRRIIYIGLNIVWIVFLIGRILDGITDPLIGTWSDNTSTTRRRPWYFGPK